MFAVSEAKNEPPKILKRWLLKSSRTLPMRKNNSSCPEGCSDLTFVPFSKITHGIALPAHAGFAIWVFLGRMKPLYRWFAPERNFTEGIVTLLDFGSSPLNCSVRNTYFVGRLPTTVPSPNMGKQSSPIYAPLSWHDNVIITSPRVIFLVEHALVFSVHSLSGTYCFKQNGVPSVISITIITWQYKKLDFELISN